MSTFELNRVGITGLLFVLVITAGFLIVLGSRRKFSGERLRVIPAFVRLGKALSLAIEAGTRVHISVGRGGVFYLPGAATFAGLRFLKRIFRRAGMGDRLPIALNGDPLVDILSNDVIRGTDRPGETRHIPELPASQLTGLTPFSFAGGALPQIASERATATVFAGHFGTEIGLIIDSADANGAQVFAASEGLTAQAVLAAMVDDPLLGEELFAAGAYLEEDQEILASLRIQDFTRWGLALVILVGIVLRYLGVI